MNFSLLTLVLTILLVLCTTSNAQFDQFRARELASVGGNTSLLMNSAANRRRFNRAVLRLRRRFATCRPNVCIAMDGSASISEREYELQKEFATLVLAVVGGLQGSKFAVVEYGGIVDPILGLQPASTDALFDILADESQEAPITFVGAGIQWCRSQFALMPAAVNKIVLLGDGRSTFGDTGRFGAISLAEDFEEDGVGNSICAGLIGRGNARVNRRFFLRVVRGVRQKVLAVPRWTQIVNIIVALVDQICGPSP
eukprot:GFKZ01007183.1.p1 GENE.GFKZ01007183.1~~GFKZ01007183.1.p1  ORF type:complete len:255 (-),score=22.44 GFKZ01007183.1:210-974(-)